METLSFSALASVDLNYSMLLSSLNKYSYCPGLSLYFKTLPCPPPQAGAVHMFLWKRASQAPCTGSHPVERPASWRHCVSEVWLSQAAVQACLITTVCLLMTQDTYAEMVSFFVFIVSVLMCIWQRVLYICERGCVCVHAIGVIWSFEKQFFV